MDRLTFRKYNAGSLRPADDGGGVSTVAADDDLDDLLTSVLGVELDGGGTGDDDDDDDDDEVDVFTPESVALDSSLTAL